MRETITAELEKSKQMKRDLIKLVESQDNNIAKLTLLLRMRDDKAVVVK